MAGYLIRSKGGNLVMRNPEDGIAYEVGPKEWVFFSDLPKGTGVPGDSDVTVKEVVGKSEGKKAKPYAAKGKLPPLVESEETEEGGDE